MVKLQGRGEMIGLPERCLPYCALALAIFLTVFIQSTHAEEVTVQAKPEEAKAAQEPTPQTKPKESQAKGAGGQAFDSAVVSAGMAAFERSCTKCHDAARSLDRTKDLAGWRATVKRMAGKRGAEIASGDLEPIAVYLTSRTAAPSGTAAEKETPGGTEGAAEKEKAAAAASTDTSSLSTF